MTISTVRRLALTLAAVLGLVLGLGACSRTAAPSTPAPVIRVEVTSWSGWDVPPEPGEPTPTRPPPTVYELRGEEGEVLQVPVLIGPLHVRVTGRTDDTVEVRTSEAMSPRGERGGIDLSSDQTEFTIHRGEPLAITTPTTDAGTTLTFTYR